ncbi:ATP-binding protein, partial [Bacteroidota bacterium]
FYLFSTYHKFPVIRRLFIAGKKQVDIAISFMILFLFLGGYYVFKLLLSICTHSQWNLDISENLDFNYFRLSSYFLFLIVTISYIMLSAIVFNLIKRIIGNRRFILILTILLAPIALIFLFFEPDLLWLVIMIWMYSLLIKYFRIPGNFNRLPYATFIFIAITTVLTSSLGTLAIYHHHKTKTQNEKRRYANHLFQQNDIMAEYYLAEAAEKIYNDVFIQSRLLSPFATKEIIRDKIQRVHLGNYFEKYDINILLFNGRGQPFSNSGPDYHAYKKMVDHEDFLTEYHDLYLINANQPGSPTIYLEFIEIERYESIVGYIIINLRLKRVIPSNVFPKLLVDDRFDMTDEDISFGYVMFKQGELVTQSGEHQNMQAEKGLLQDGKTYTKGFSSGNNSYIGFKGENETVILISSDKYNFRKLAGNFSFLFCVFSLVSLMVLLIVAVAYQFSGRNLNYATRIQLFLNIAFIVPLIVVSITTLTRLSRNYTEEMDDRYQDIAENLAINITPFLDDYLSNKSDIINREGLTNELSMVANIAECDINFFGTGNLQGKLISSTQSLIYDKGILSRYINPSAGAGLYSGIRNQMVLNENAGELEYKSAYTRIESPGTGNLLGVLSIPFFSSKQEINEKVSDLLLNILNIFTLIFIIFLIISYFTSFYLTHPIRLLIQKIRKTSLEGDNEPLKYNSNDEIGQIVNEYNKMLIKLEESRIALAKTEKESAWREMARQVAHEIKNPLTPMKLTIQHLEMRIKSKKDSESKTLEKSLNSLLHNIETLSGIASSFSTYAQMPAPEIKEFDILGLLRKTADLYSNEGEAQIELELPDKEIMTNGDPNWLGRAISNLIINGIQSVEQDRQAIVHVKLAEKENSKILISIKDNGSGITEEAQDKVFTPNFSTKYSGSGIGLAVAKRAVEHANGKIWFKTSMGEGTTFFVELHSSG